MLSKSKFVICISILALLTGCSEAPKQMSMPPTSVQISAVKVGPLKETSDYLGTVKSRKSVTLLPNIDGHVTQISVTSGQFVPAGTKIMQIDSRMQSAQTNAVKAAADSVESDLATTQATLASLQSTLRSKQANVDYTKTQYDRYQNLLNEGAVSQAELDGWKNNYTAAQADRDATLQQIQAQRMTIQKYERSHKQALANFQAQKENLRYYEITAPFAGTIGDIPVKVGDHVSSATTLTTLTENHPLEVYISIPAEKAIAIKKGTPVTLLSTDGQIYGNSNVFFIAPTVDPNSQTVLIKTLYLNEDNDLRADQTVKAQILWQERNGISVPTKAVLQTAGKYFVFVAENKDGKLFAKEKEIEIYGIEGNSYQVKSGLKPTERIITTGIQRLADGAPIMDNSQISENH
jgi:multidrug efflux pump subunit AcrA (membrane-fusion protein)